MQKPNPSPGELPQRAAAALTLLRERRPRVHCITNAVAQNFTANMLLAAGCTPSMTIAPEEVGAFVASADALLVNLGTFDAERRKAVEIAVATATDNAIPWALDPVLIDRSRPRAQFARGLIDCVPRVMRLNGAEFTVLSGRGDDAEAVADYARGHGCVIARSGETDFVSDGNRHAALANGHPLMAKVTAMGCAGSALIAACLAVEPDAFTAAAAGLLLLGVAGELAAKEAKGPASFAVAIIDALYALNGGALLERARVS
ncbi:MAG TPA: hydroxyethylthiazole kinase [Pseudolabrys sp.]|nr:hydroxyethylthiazole kinase [Pseudolabrys sp.]